MLLRATFSVSLTAFLLGTVLALHGTAKITLTEPCTRAFCTILEHGLRAAPWGAAPLIQAAFAQKSQTIRTKRWHDYLSNPSLGFLQTFLLLSAFLAKFIPRKYHNSNWINTKKLFNTHSNGTKVLNYPVGRHPAKQTTSYIARIYSDFDSCL